jgi:hypothetical protein
MTGAKAFGFSASITMASNPALMKPLTAAIWASTFSPVETSLNSFSFAATPGCAA